MLCYIKCKVSATTIKILHFSNFFIKKFQGSLVEQQSTKTAFNHENAQTKKSVGASKAPPPVGFPRLAYLTVQEFQSVPKYMKGRFTYDMFNQIVDEYNSALEEKYEFMRKGFQAMASIQDKKR